METFIAFFSYKYGGMGLGVFVLFSVLWFQLYISFKGKFDNKWLKVGIPAVLSYMGTSIICFIISQDTRVFIYPIVLPVITIFMEVYYLNQKPNPYFPANKDEDQGRYPLRRFDVVLVFAFAFLMHLLLRAVL